MKYDWKILGDFVSLLPELKNDEVWFVSLSARKKYLDSEQAKEINLNHAEMFNRKIIRSLEKFPQILERLSADGYYTKDGHPYPENSLVVYFNVNPTGMIRAYEKFSGKVTQLLADLALKEGPIAEHTITQIRKLDVLFMNEIQKQRATKHFIDIDVDTKDEVVYDKLTNGLRDRGAEYITVVTHGGYHVLVWRKTLKFNYNELVKECDLMTDEEVIVNPNEMIPLPGTMQGGHLVSFEI